MVMILIMHEDDVDGNDDDAWSNYNINNIIY